MGRSSAKIFATSSSEVMLAQAVFLISEIRHCSDDAAVAAAVTVTSFIANVYIDQPTALMHLLSFLLPVTSQSTQAAFKSRSCQSLYLSRERAGQEKQVIVSASRYRLVCNDKDLMQCQSGIWPPPPISAANAYSSVVGWRPSAGRPRMFIARPELRFYSSGLLDSARTCSFVDVHF